MHLLGNYVLIRKLLTVVFLALALMGFTRARFQVVLQIPGSNIIDDLSNFVVDDIGNQVVAS